MPSSALPAASRASAATGAPSGAVPDPTLVVIGLVLGAAFAWLVARSHFGAKLASLEALVKELKDQRSTREGEVAALRMRLEQGQGERAEAGTRLEATRQNLEDQRRLLGRGRGGPPQTFHAPSSRVLPPTDHHVP